MSNQNHTTLYIGVTSDIVNRIYQHKTKKHQGFTAKYNCNKLVYFEEFIDIQMAISREKQIKSGSRNKKIQLIENKNPDWNDLSENWLFITN